MSDNDLSMSDNTIEHQFHKKDQKTLEVLSIQLASAILPYVYYYRQDTTDAKFKEFEKYATTNINIFYDFARYIHKKYLFAAEFMKKKG